MSNYTDLEPYRLCGYPRDVETFSGRSFTYAYRGPSATLAAKRPKPNDDWNGYPVESTSIYQLEASTISELLIEVRSPDMAAATAAAAELVNNEFPYHEVEAVPVEKSLRTHPVFNTMTAAEWAEIDAWIEEKDTAARAAYQWWTRDANGEKTGSVNTLGTTAKPTKSQQDFAKAYLLGVQSYTEYATVARETRLFSGNDKPSSADCGVKTGGDPFTGVPSSLEWIKTSERAFKQGRSFRWTKTTEWTGVKKVLVDKSNFYI